MSSQPARPSERASNRLSAHTLRGVAHPLRVRLLNLLREDGPSTATRLAERTGQSSGATSYHLRQLAAYDFVEEAPARGGRERWWQATHRRVLLAGADAREAPEAAQTYLRAVAAEYAERVDRWLNEAPGLPIEWDQAATLSNWRLRLTAAEATALLGAIEDVIVACRAESDDATPGAPDDAERVDVQIQLMPFLGRPR